MGEKRGCDIMDCADTVLDTDLTLASDSVSSITASIL